jgi:hypothetical protein
VCSFFLQIEDAKTTAGIGNEGYGSRSQPYMQKS